MRRRSLGSPPALTRAPDEAGEPLPDRWSTRPGPHHVKAAAALLQLPAGGDPALVAACRATVALDRRAEASWPCEELHPFLYGLEGLLMLARSEASMRPSRSTNA